MIERVDLAGIETKLEEATLEKRLNFYLDNNLWYDASRDLNQIRDCPQMWRKLLKAIGLENLDQEPIAGSAVVRETSF